MRWLDSVCSIPAAQFKEHIRRTVEFSALHGAAVWLTWSFIYPAQQALLGESPHAIVFFAPALLFLPAAIKALATWMYAWWAAIYILPTAMLQHMILGFGWDGQHLLVLLVYLIMPPLMRNLLQLAGLKSGRASALKSWRSMFAILLMSSIATAGALILVHETSLPLSQTLAFIGLVLVGDTAGAAIILLLLIVYFRQRDIARRQAARKDEI